MSRYQSAKKPPKIFVADFETTVYEGQTSTEVWAAALVNLYDPDEYESVEIYHDIYSFFRRILKLASSDNCVIYFHNLKFDGSFILSYLERSEYWRQYTYEFIDDETGKTKRAFEGTAYKMPSGSYMYSISDKGLWYTIRLQVGNHYIEFRDSLKLLPFSVAQIGKGFDTKHKKLTMEYEGNRYAGCEITDEEKQYIANDVLVVKEGLQYMLSIGMDKLTIGSCALSEFKNLIGKDYYNEIFPDLTQMWITDDLSYDAYLRKAYKGGWCYVNPKYQNLEIKHIGTTCDVNSLYPSVLLSPYRYPVGYPHFFIGDVPDEIKNDPEKYYFIRVRTRFYMKKDKLPCIQLKGNPMYAGREREWLESSDVMNVKTKELSRDFRDWDGHVRPAIPEMTLTMTDWELIQECYNLEDTEIIDGVWFDTKMGIFDTYINKYAKMKIEAPTPSIKQTAKLMLNSLYGKLSTNPLNYYKILYTDENGVLRSLSPTRGEDKTAGFIAAGAACTSYARSFTLKAAIANIDVFCYSDTDSIHLICGPDEVKGAPEDPKAFCHWKYETCWDYAKFVRAKTYVEHVTHENRKEVDPYYNLKCAGMSDRVKGLFLKSVEQNFDVNEIMQSPELDEKEKEFILTPRTFKDFDIGLEIPGMLKATQVPGGTLLEKRTYKMHRNVWL